MNLSRIKRLVQLIGLLQAGKGQSVNTLADGCRVSRRTIFRDLDVLRQAGVPLLFDDDRGCYRIPGTYCLPPTNFTAAEALSIMILCYELGQGARLPFCGQANSAASKLESTLPTRLRDYVREAAGAVNIKAGPRSPLEGREPIYEQLLGCVARRQPVRICYDSVYEGGPDPNQTEPLSAALQPAQLVCDRALVVAPRNQDV